MNEISDENPTRQFKDTRAPQLEHVAYPLTQHDAGTACPFTAAPDGVSVFVASDRPSGEARHRVATLSHGRFCPRLFLASPQGLPGRNNAQITPAILA